MAGMNLSIRENGNKIERCTAAKTAATAKQGMVSLFVYDVSQALL